MGTIQESIRRSVQGHTPIVYLLSPEEDRVMRGLREEAGDSYSVRVWTCNDGLEGVEDEGGARDPVKALRVMRACTDRTFFVMKDLAPFMKEAEVVRALRDLYYASGDDSPRFLFILCADLTLPDSVQKEVQLIEISPPDETEIGVQVRDLLTAQPDYVLPDGAEQELVLALKGLTESEIRHVLHRAFLSGAETGEALMEEVFSEKKAIVKKSGFLEFAPPRWEIGQVGGLDRLKEWLLRRRHMFGRDALEAGVPVPKGILIMGVSGCGKSLCVKVTSSLWNVPMFRLDMNLVFSGMYGSPEEAFHKALKTIESVAPAVLWIDEIENALGIEDDGLKIDSHIFSTFLTWMQEKPPLVFIAATANRIQALPAEIIRKGRFDEVFFCDLPAEKERIEIFRIHLMRNNADLDKFDFKMLGIMSEGFNGAEIEQAVVSARTEAFYEGRPFNERDLTETLANIVPLSDTMEQQIKAIRSWAFSRATPASKYSKAAKRR